MNLEENTEYSATQLADILKNTNRPFWAMNDTKNTEDRIYFCDFKPRKKYMYNGKWRTIKKIRELSPYEKINFLNIYDKRKHEFRKIDITTLSFLKVGKCRFKVKQIEDIESYPRVKLKRLP
tara:strand:- start:4072 stop:4437 length:366 start_codon:yes stop_codon:yes gene_type:complete